MTREIAEELVNDLLAAIHDAEVFSDKPSYQRAKEELVEKVICALTGEAQEERK